MLRSKLEEPPALKAMMSDSIAIDSALTWTMGAEFANSFVKTTWGKLP